MPSIGIDNRFLSEQIRKAQSNIVECNETIADPNCSSTKRTFYRNELKKEQTKLFGLQKVVIDALTLFGVDMTESYKSHPELRDRLWGLVVTALAKVQDEADKMVAAQTTTGHMPSHAPEGRSKGKGA